MIDTIAPEATANERNYIADEFIHMTPLVLLESTARSLADFDNNFDDDNDPQEVVMTTALHGIARIMLADDFESMQLIAEEVRRGLIKEFAR